MNEAEESPVKVSIPRDAVERAIAALVECAQDLEAELHARYPKESIEAYPTERRRFERDMGAVRAALAAARGLDWREPTSEGADND